MIISDTDGNKNDSTVLAKMTKDVTFFYYTVFFPKKMDNISLGCQRQTTYIIL